MFDKGNLFDKAKMVKNIVPPPQSFPIKGDIGSFWDLPIGNTGSVYDLPLKNLSAEKVIPNVLTQAGVSNVQVLPSIHPISSWMEYPGHKEAAIVLTGLAMLGGIMYYQSSTPSVSVASQIEWNRPNNMVHQVQQTFTNTGPSEQVGTRVSDLSTDQALSVTQLLEKFDSTPSERAVQQLKQVLSGVASLGSTLTGAINQVTEIRKQQAAEIDRAWLRYLHEFAELDDLFKEHPEIQNHFINEGIIEAPQVHADAFNKEIKMVMGEELDPIEKVLDGEGYVIQESSSTTEDNMDLFTPPILYTDDTTLWQEDNGEAMGDVATQLHKQMEEAHQQNQGDTKTLSKIPTLEQIQKKVDEAQDNQATKQAVANFQFMLPALSFALTSGSNCTELKGWGVDKFIQEWFPTPAQTLRDRIVSRLPFGARLALMVHRSSTQLKWGWDVLKWVMWLRTGT